MPPAPETPTLRSPGAAPPPETGPRTERGLGPERVDPGASTERAPVDPGAPTERAPGGGEDGMRRPLAESVRPPDNAPRTERGLGPERVDPGAVTERAPVDPGAVTERAPGDGPRELTPAEHDAAMRRIGELEANGGVYERTPDGELVRDAGGNAVYTSEFRELRQTLNEHVQAVEQRTTADAERGHAAAGESNAAAEGPPIGGGRWASGPEARAVSPHEAPVQTGDAQAVEGGSRAGRDPDPGFSRTEPVDAKVADPGFSVPESADAKNPDPGFSVPDSIDGRRGEGVPGSRHVELGPNGNDRPSLSRTQPGASPYARTEAATGENAGHGQHRGAGAAEGPRQDEGATRAAEKADVRTELDASDRARTNVEEIEKAGRAYDGNGNPTPEYTAARDVQRALVEARAAEIRADYRARFGR